MKKRYKLIVTPLFTIKKEIVEIKDDIEVKDEITLKNVEYISEDITNEVYSK